MLISSGRHFAEKSVYSISVSVCAKLAFFYLIFVAIPIMDAALSKCEQTQPFIIH